jgi:chloramphenicol-sensitive protein RarD
MTSRQADHGRAGLLCGLGAVSIWGFLPLVFHGISGLDNVEILAWRLLGALAVVVIAVTILRKWPGVMAVARQPRGVGMLAVCALLIFLNWLIFIIAVRSGHILEASLGYFITPLVNVVLGLLFLRERLRPWQIVAVAVAVAGVLALVVHGGGAPWIPVALALSFGFYGLIRKVIPTDVLEGLTVETILLAPFAAAYLFFGGMSQSAAYSSTNILLIALIGLLTVLTLLLFTAAARRMAYSTLGIIQYVGPSIQFLVGLRLGEKFLPIHAVTFGFIWTGLVIYAVDGLRHRARSIAVLEPAE